MVIFITGSAGFICSNLVRVLIGQNYEILNLDKLTYAGNPDSLSDLEVEPGYHFIGGDIADKGLLKGLLFKYKPQAILNLAAESHVDRSIDSPEEFIQTNIVGTFRLLEACRRKYRVRSQKV